MAIISKEMTEARAKARARVSTLVRESWTFALRAGISVRELKENSILRYADGTLPELDMLALEILAAVDPSLMGGIVPNGVSDSLRLRTLG